MYIIRLDDASDHMNIENWMRIEKLLEKYNICPIVGIIPDNQDIELTNLYTQNHTFWDLADTWLSKGWIPAMHGYEHQYETQSGGVNPVNNRSEFAGLPLSVQEEKIEKGYEILLKHNIVPEIFFAPAHTYDENTIKALKNKTKIHIISDTIATNIYYQDDFYFLPLQCGKARNLPFKFVTFCYHPNIMLEKDFIYLEAFIKKYKDRFDGDYKKYLTKRSYTWIDQVFSKLYFTIRNRRKG